MPTKKHSFELDQNIIIRTVTNYFTGRVSAVTEADIVLQDAAWIAYTGRWSIALREGAEHLDEVEPYPSWCVVSRGAIVDWAPWDHELPRKMK